MRFVVAARVLFVVMANRTAVLEGAASTSKADCVWPLLVDGPRGLPYPNKVCNAPKLFICSSRVQSW